MARAVRFDHYGGIDVLRVEEVDLPKAPAGEAVVQIRAAGINPGEASIRQGFLHDRFPATFPSGEGSDLAGVVTEVGDGVTSVSVGDEVFGWSDRRASHAEYAVVPVGQLLPKPANLSWEVAGSLFVAGTTAYAAVRAVGISAATGAGDALVVSAAAGGVGSVTSQLARAWGARVIGIASEANHAWLSSVGVTPVAYGDGLADRIRTLAPSGVDAFIDTFGPDYVRLALDLGVAKDRIDTIIAFALAEEVGVKAEGSAFASTAEALGEVAGLVASGQIEVPIAATFPLDQVQAAYTELEKRHSRGKIVLIP